MHNVVSLTRVQDDSQSSEDDASDSKLFAAAKSLQQEISLNLTYFRILLEAHEGFLSHVVNQNKKGLGFRPEASLERLKLVVRKATGQKTRADILRNRAQNILDFASDIPFSLPKTSCLCFADVEQNHHPTSSARHRASQALGRSGATYPA